MDKGQPLTFLEQVRLGQTEWFRYLAGIILILFFWFILGSLFVLVPALWAMADGNPNTAVNPQTGLVDGINPVFSFITAILTFAPLIAGVFVVVRFVHGRPFLSLITPARQLNWRRLWQGFGLWLLLVALSSLVEYLLHPGRYTVVFQASRFVPFALAVLLFIPMQTTAEELLFRGYLLQATGHLSRNFWLLALVNGILFMVPHLGNPEMAASPILLPLFYFSFGAIFAFITLRDNGAELALGAHAANNLYAGLFANYTNSALQTESIFLVTELDPVFSLLSFWVMAVIFYLVLVGRRSVRIQTEGALND